MIHCLPPFILQDDVGVADIIRLVETIKEESTDLGDVKDIGITIILNIIITLLSTILCYLLISVTTIGPYPSILLACICIV